MLVLWGLKVQKLRLESPTWCPYAGLDCLGILGITGIRGLWDHRSLKKDTRLIIAKTFCHGLGLRAKVFQPLPFPASVEGRHPLGGAGAEVAKAVAPRLLLILQAPNRRSTSLANLQTWCQDTPQHPNQYGHGMAYWNRGNQRSECIH